MARHRLVSTIFPRAARRAFVALLALGGAVDPAAAQAPAPWSFFGGDVSNTRASTSPPANVNAPTQINPRTAPKLALLWAHSTVGDVSATPTVEQGGLYVPDYAGFLYKLNPDTGALIWSHPLSDYLGVFGYSRNSPAIGELGEIVLGNQLATGGAAPGARVLSIDKTTGALRWQATVDPSPRAFVTTSPVIYNRRVYVGVTASDESMTATVPNFQPSFRGSVVALDEATGAVVWRFYTVPPGYTGGAVWGSSPVAWRAGNALLVGTGNNLSVPAAASTCLTTAAAGPTARLACLDPTDYVDSLLSLDLGTGRVNWSRRTDADTWTVACLRGPPAACPTPTGLDNDFGSAPNLVFLNNFVGVPDDRGGTSKSYFLGAGQKSGFYHGLNPYNGGLYWSTYMGQGQIVWGSAINIGVRDAAYVALENRPHWSNVLAGRNGVAIPWNAGAWASISLYTGKFNWQVPTYGQDIATPGYGGAATGPVSLSNRVMFAGSTSGYMTAIDGNSGNLLWTFNAGGSIIGGPSIYNETLYFGAGAVRSGPGSVHTVFACRVPAPP